MENDPFDAVANPHRETIRKALNAAFGSAVVQMIAPVGGGAPGAFPFGFILGIDAILCGWRARQARCAPPTSTRQCASRRQPELPHTSITSMRGHERGCSKSYAKRIRRYFSSVGNRP